jgi:hypothetical protein
VREHPHIVRVRAWEETCARPISMFTDNPAHGNCTVVRTRLKIRKAPHIDVHLCAEVFRISPAFAYTHIFSLPLFTVTDEHSFIKER